MVCPLYCTGDGGLSHGLSPVLRKNRSMRWIHRSVLLKASVSLPDHFEEADPIVNSELTINIKNVLL